MDPIKENKVALYLDYKDIDALFAASKTQRILQEISKGMGGNLKDLLFTTIDRGDSLIDNKPVCECGVTEVEHGSREICPVCLSYAEPITERSVTPSLFAATPYKIDQFLAPYLYQAMRYAFDIGTTKDPYNPFVALLGRHNPTNPIHKVVLNRMPDDLIGYNNATKDFPRFILTLVDIIFDIINPKEKGVVSREMTAAHKKKIKILPELWQAREMAESLTHFNLPHTSKVLPIRSKLLMTLEEGTFSTTSITTDMYAKAIVYLNNLPYDESKMTPREKTVYRPDARIVRFYEMYAEMRAIFYKEEGQKGGGMRTDTITARSGLVLRSVQTQECNPHHSEQLALPYSQSIVVFLPYIVRWYKENKGWSSDKIIQFVEKYTREHNHELWTVMNSILQKITEEGGIAYSIRYPSIYRTSGLTNTMAYIKKDPNDKTIGVPASSLAGQNGDFDGDNITVRIILIKKVAAAFERLRVRASALDIAKEGEFSHIVEIPQPTIMCWANYLRGVDKTV